MGLFNILDSILVFILRKDKNATKKFVKNHPDIKGEQKKINKRAKQVQKDWENVPDPFDMIMGKRKPTPLDKDKKQGENKMAHAGISWAYIMINDEEFNPRVDRINLTDNISFEAYETFKQKYSSLCGALFTSITERELRLDIPFSGYLGTDSTGENELLLRSFLDNNDAPLSHYQESQGFKIFKPLGLSKDSIDKEAYVLFSKILKNVNGYDDEYGYLELGFDDLRGFVVTDGESEWEVSITISEEGGQWLK